MLKLLESPAGTKAVILPHAYCYADDNVLLVAEAAIKQWLHDHPLGRRQEREAFSVYVMLTDAADWQWLAKETLSIDVEGTGENWTAKPFPVEGMPEIAQWEVSL